MLVCARLNMEILIKVVLQDVIRYSMSVITIRVAREIKEKLEKYNVNISETVRKLLDKYLVELELRDLGERLELLKERLSNKIDPKLVAKLVREDRETH